jgi:hypothetical protein
MTKIRIENQWGAETYFIGKKRIDHREVTKLWIIYPDGHREARNIVYNEIRQDVCDMGHIYRVINTVPHVVEIVNGLELIIPIHNYKEAEFIEE